MISKIAIKPIAFCSHQCDKITRLSCEHLAIYNNEFLPSELVFFQSRFNCFEQIPHKISKIAKDFKCLTKWYTSKATI